MKRTLFGFLIAFCALQSGVQAQTSEYGKFKLDTKRARTTTSYFNDINEIVGNNLIRVNYRTVDFLNPSYGYYNVDKTLSYKWGLDLSLAFPFFPFMLDFGCMYGEFGLQNMSKMSLYPYSYEHKITNEGLYSYFSFFPLYDLGWLSNIFTPYIGIGYQTSSLKVSMKPSVKYADTIESASYALGGVMCKVGTMVNFGSFGLNGEYRYKMTSDTYKKMSELTFGLIIKI